MALSEFHAAGQHIGFPARVASFFSALARGIEISKQGNLRLDQVHRLQAMSDAELKALGIARDDVVRHVFADLFYA